MRIFVTGRSGCGKSTFAKLLAKRLRYDYVDLDKVSHTIYEDENITNGVVEIFGKDILEKGIIDRKKLGAKLFSESDKSKVELFNKITAEKIKELALAYMDRDVVVDWILLPKTEFYHMADIKILVKAVDDNLRFKKIMARDNIDIEYLRSRESAGIEYDEATFDYVINNDYIDSNLEAKVEEIYSDIVR